MYVCVRGVIVSSFYDFDIWFWNSSDWEVLFVFSSYCYVSVKVDENSLTNNYFNNTIYNLRCLICSLVYKTSLPRQCLECMYQARDVRGHAFVC